MIYAKATPLSSGGTLSINETFVIVRLSLHPQPRPGRSDMEHSILLCMVEIILPTLFYRDILSQENYM